MKYTSAFCPFTAKIKSSSWDNELQCKELLRNLPGKRLVYRGTWKQRSVVVKLFIDSNSACRHWAREKAGGEALKVAQISTPELLYSGQLTDDTPVLVFDFIPEAQTALEVWNGLSTLEPRVELLRRLAELVGELHDAGLVQEDLHLENFLVSDDQIYVIDGDAVCVRQAGKPLDLKASSRNLALLFAQFPPDHDDLIETAALDYAKQRNMSSQPLLERLKHDLPAVRRVRRRKYIAKCTRTCSEFIRTRVNGRVAVFRRDQQGDALTRLLDDPEAFMQPGEFLKDGISSTVVRVRGEGYDWVVKRYNIKGFRHAIRRCVRSTRAWTSWRNSHRLKISGITTPRAVAVIEKRIGPLRSTGYYVCDFVDAPRAKEVFQSNKVSDSEKKLLAEKFVHLFTLFHQLRIHHGDCKAQNFLFKDHQLWVLDLDAMQECSTAAGFERLFRIDRSRFLLNWMAQPELQQWFDEHLLDNGRQ